MIFLKISSLLSVTEQVIQNRQKSAVDSCFHPQAFTPLLSSEFYVPWSDCV